MVENYCRNKVFSRTYCKKFDAYARRYGKYLSRQSDRELPRTHFFSIYTTTSCKNASEMSGVLLVFLVLFSTKEGNVILKNLKATYLSTKSIMINAIIRIIIHQMKMKIIIIKNVKASHL